MTVLYICSEYPPGKIGGIGSMTRTLARAMVNAGHTVLVAGLYLPGYGGADFETDEGVKVWRKRLLVDVGLIRNNYSFIDTLLIKSLSASGILQKDLVKNITKFNEFVGTLISQFNVDIIEWPDFNDSFQYLGTAVKWPAFNVPLVVKFNGTQSFLNYPAKSPLDSKLYSQEKEHIDRADVLAAVSRHTAESYQRLYDLQKPVTILYNSVEVPDVTWQPDQSQPKIIFTGALTERKGLISLIKAWDIVYKKHPEAVLEIFGKGKINTFLKDASFKVKRSIHYQGFRSKQEFYTSMATASAAIFPSYTECFAFAPLEAMAAGCPVINTERCSGPELINHGINGLLIDPGNPQQMANSMISLVENSTLRKKLSVNGRQTVIEHFSIDKSIQDHTQFYEQAIRQYHKKAITI